MGETVQRESWASRLGTVMAMAGMAIGIGNVWKFPYLVGQYGGGAFVFAYLICMAVIVMPLAFVEAALGKGLQGGEITAWSAILKNQKAGTVVGSAFSLSYAAENFFAVVVNAMPAYFIWVFISGMPKVMDPSTIYEYMKAEQDIPMLIISGLISAATMAVLIFGIVKGIEKCCKFMIPAILFIFLIITVFAALTVDNIAAGYNFYLNPDFSRLKDINLWQAALGQACFSIGIGPGCILCYGTHIKKHGDITLSILTVVFLDTTAALLAGFAIIPTCVGLGLTPESGSGLIFKVLPQALVNIPGGMLLGVLAMLAVFCAAFTSGIAQMECAITSLEDINVDRKKSIAIVGIVSFVMALICTVNDSQFDFWNNFIGNYAFVITALIGGVCYNYLYGTKKIREKFINDGSVFKLGSWFDPLVRFIAVPLMVIIMVLSII